ncbi:MAG: hypothetical protein AB7K86_17535 [Rhodospirillales bacterium]
MSNPMRRATAAAIVAVLFAATAAGQERPPPSVLGPMLDALSGGVGTRQQAPPSGPVTSGVNRAAFSYCTQLNRSGLEVALAAAPMSDQARRLLFAAGSTEELFAYCADQINHHLCTRDIVGLAGSFLTAGPAGNSVVDGTGGVAQDAAEKRASALGLVFGVAGAVGGAAASGNAGTAARTGAAGAIGGYAAGSQAGGAAGVAACDRNRATMAEVSDLFRQPLAGRSVGEVDRFMQANARFVPAERQEALRYLQQVSQRLRQSSADLWQRLNQ